MKKWTLFFFLIFIYSPIYAQSASFSTLYHFNDHYNPHYETNVILTSDKKTLYGHRQNYIYQYSLDSGTFELLRHAGKSEKGAYYSYDGQLTLSKNQPYLYGAKSAGVDGNAIYRLNLQTLEEEILHQFTDYRIQGYIPLGGLVLDAEEKYVYGIANAGGLGKGTNDPWSLGVIFRIALTGVKPTYEVLHYFEGDRHGGAPIGNLVLSPNGRYLYGITDKKGEKNCGTLFKLELDETNQFPLTTLHSFYCTLEGRPNDLIMSKDGRFLYGTAYKNNWSNNPGVVFRLTVRTSEFNVIHSFNDKEGLLPIGLILSTNQKTLYGATQLSGYRGYRQGNIYQITLDNDTFNFSILYDFNQRLPEYMRVEDIMALDEEKSIIYAATSTGGMSGKGVIFQLAI